MYHEMKERQKRFIDDGTYSIIQDLSEYYDPEVGVFDYVERSKERDVTHALWGNLFASPENDGHNFKKIGFNFKIPDSLLSTRGIYRMVHTTYDHYSDISTSYFSPVVYSTLRQCWSQFLKILERCSHHYQFIN